MMHHPNMHHQPMSGHPPQHLTGHQAMSAHHTLPPPQLHRENRHVTLTSMYCRVPLGAGAGGGALGLPVHHAPRPHAARPLHPPHHQHHHNHQVPQMKPMRRGYMGGGYGAPVVHTYAPPAPLHPPPPDTHNNHHNAQNNVVSAVSPGAEEPPAPAEAEGGEERAPDDTPANSKEKTPMCLVNELARYNKIKHQYRLTSESGPAHKKVFTVTLRLGDTEEYTAEGSSIKRAQHAAARAALAGTGLAAPPARAAAAGGAPAPRHSVMPTVELNALAMKLCQPAVYTSVPCVSLAARGRGWAPGALLYRVRVAVGGRAWLGEGGTPQAARHDAAARALHQLRDLPHDPADTPAEDENSDPLSEVKSPVSLVHELALKRNLTVTFTVKSERGPPHMRVFITICTVGDMETEGEGNGKKVSKRRAAEKMLEEMRRRWPPALLRPRLSHDKRRHQPTKKKPRNLIKVGEESGGAGGAGAGGDNPISRLAVARHAQRARSPQYVVVEERGAARRREFLVQCSAPPHSATGLGPNKKTAKRRAAGNVLRAMEQLQDKESAAPAAASAEARQPVPGVLLMDYHNQRPGQPQTPQTPQNGVNEPSPAGGAAAGGSSPGARDQLMYLSHLLGFTVQFSDFPKRNHGEYLSLVSLSTEPPVMCHGGGPSTRHSHEQCARAALHALALMGLDTMQNGASSTTSKPSAVPNGISE